MVRKVFIVSRGNIEMYEELRRALTGQSDVDVIYDRRESNPQEPSHAAIRFGLALADVGDRRMPSHVDNDLRIRGWAVANVDDEDDDQRITD